MRASTGDGDDVLDPFDELDPLDLEEAQAERGQSGAQSAGYPDNPWMENPRLLKPGVNRTRGVYVCACGRFKQERSKRP